MFRSRAEKKVADAGYDPKRLPPGQYLTEKWPVLHAGSVPRTDLATWDFRVFGAVENELVLSYDELQALPQTEITTDIHCVTRWSRFDTSFRGVHWREIAKLVKPLPEARFVLAHSEQDFTANVPLAALEDEQSLVAWEADGEPSSPDHGWPLRLVVPSRYFWKSAKWLRGIEFLPKDRPASGSATATTTTPITGKSSATASSAESLDRVIGRSRRRSITQPDPPPPFPRKAACPGGFSLSPTEKTKGRLRPALARSSARGLVTSCRPCRACLRRRPRPASPGPRPRRPPS